MSVLYVFFGCKDTKKKRHGRFFDEKRCDKVEMLDMGCCRYADLVSRVLLLAIEESEMLPCRIFLVFLQNLFRDCVTA